MRYPKECPAFEVLSDGPYIRRGAIVEGILPVSHAPRSVQRRMERPPSWRVIAEYIGVRVVNSRDLYDAGIAERTFALTFDSLRPLTDAARLLVAEASS